jgi:WD40 repeat protein
MLRTGYALALVVLGVMPNVSPAQTSPAAEVGGPPVAEIAISPDGSTIAVANGDSVVQLLDAATFSPKRVIAASGRTWTGVAWSPDGLELATAGGVPGDGAVAQWSPGTGALVRELPFEGVGTDACYAADGSVLAAVGLAGSRGRLGVWTAATGAERFTLQLLDATTRVACAPDGSAVAVGFDGGNVRIYASSDGSELSELTSGGTAHGLAYTPDGSRIVVGNGGALTIWDASSGALLHTVDATSAGIDSLAVAPDGSVILAGVTDLGVVAVDPVTGAEQWASHTVGPLDEATIAAIAFRSADEAVVYDNLEQPTEIDRISVRPSRLDVAGATPLQVLVGCPATVRDAAWSADGTLVATACSDGTARLWDPDTGALLHLLDAHSSNVTSVDLSPDGTLVATGSSDDTAILWSTATGAIAHTLTGHASTVTDVSFSPDSSRLATGSLDTDVVLWSTATGLEVDRLDHNRVINHLEYAPDGSEIAASAANDLMFWDAATLAEIGTLPISGKLAYAPDGNRLVVLATDWAGIIDRANGAPLATFSTNLNHNDVAYARDGSRVLIATNDRTADLWSPFDRALLQQLEHAGTGSAVALSPNADRVLYASGGTVLITAADRHEPRTTLPHTGAQTSLGPIAFSPDGRYLLTSDNLYARMREIAGDREAHWFGPASTGLTALAYSPDGTSVATAHGSSVHLWAADSGDELHELLHSSTVRSMAFAPDGGVIAAGCDDGSIHIWDVASGTETMSPLAHGAQLSVVRLSPDGTLLASSATNQTVLVWSTTTGSQVASFAASSPYALAFSADSSRLYTGAFISFQRKLIEWDIATESELRRWDLGNYDFALAPDGRHAAIGTADSTVEIWNLDTTTMLRELVGLSTRAEHVELSPDGTVVAATEISGGTPHAVLWETGISGRTAVPIEIGETISATAPHLLWSDFVIDLSSRAPTNLVATLTPGAERDWRLLGRWGELPTFAAFDWHGARRSDGSVVMAMAAPPRRPGLRLGLGGGLERRRERSIRALGGRGGPVPGLDLSEPRRQQRHDQRGCHRPRLRARA